MNNVLMRRWNNNCQLHLERFHQAAGPALWLHSW